MISHEMMLLRSLNNPNVQALCSLVVRRSCSGIDKIAEDKILRWLKEGGEKELQRHRGRLKSDPHMQAARSMNVLDDYMHSKILADNRILPKSLELRLKLDKVWEKLKGEIWLNWKSAGEPDIKEFMRTDQVQPIRHRMEDLDALAKRVNNAIIEDSLLFRGRSPVRHAKGFILEDRIAEALKHSETTPRKHKKVVDSERERPRLKSTCCRETPPDDHFRLPNSTGN
jgi:hypothetical protein